MTFWQSLAMINLWQVAYAAGLVALFYWRGPSLIAWVLLADFVAILAILAAMDFGWLVREDGSDQVTGAVLVVWCIAAAVLVTQPGLARVLAAMGSVGIVMFGLTLFYGVQIPTTSAIVNAIAVFQIVVALIGTGDGGGAVHRPSDRPLPVAVSAGNLGYSARGMAETSPLVLVDSWKVK